MTEKTLTAFSQTDIEKKIDAFLAEDQPFKVLDLIMPISGATRFEYRGIHVRKWCAAGNTRFDAAVRLL